MYETPTKSKMNFNAEVYHDLIIWNKVIVTEPPITRSFSIDELRAFMDSTDTVLTSTHTKVRIPHTST